MEIALSLFLVVGATAVILNWGRFVGKYSFRISRLEYINTQLKYQCLLLGVSLVVLIVLCFINYNNLMAYFSFGDVLAPAKAVPWLILPEGSWLAQGLDLSFFITLATSVFIFMQFRKTGGSLRSLWPFLPWVVLISLNNAFAEEIVYRLGVVVPLAGTFDSSVIFLVSAVVFGLPHLRGMPNGIVGALMAGVLGWILAKSVVETHGLFWAWFIHFLQDIVIFSAFVMAAAKKESPQA